MIKIKRQKNKGFTLVETMVAIFILTISLTAFMSVVASSIFTARYSRNEITANYLTQEVVDYIRNDRDTKVLLGNTTWSGFLAKYNSCTTSGNLCYIDVPGDSISSSCHQGDCYLYYYPNKTNGAYYGHKTNNGSSDGKIKTSFQRKVVVKQNTTNTDQVDITVTVSWASGGRTISRTLETSLLRW